MDEAGRADVYRPSALPTHLTIRSPRREAVVLSLSGAGAGIASTPARTFATKVSLESVLSRGDDGGDSNRAGKIVYAGNGTLTTMTARVAGTDLQASAISR